MRAFAVYLNGKRLYTAGVDGDGVLTAIVRNAVRGGRDDLALDAGGLISSSKEHVQWKTYRLKVGDVVRVEIIETAAIDKPRRRYRDDPTAIMEAKKRYVREYAKELGWAITTRKRKSK